MYALFEDAGKFHAGRVMTEADTSMQIELDSGKRVKVKSANVLLQFEQPQPAELITSAQTLAKEIDLDLAWEFAPEEEFGFADLARDYFEASAGVEKQAAALFRLFEAPHYFRRLGKGHFKKAPEECAAPTRPIAICDSRLLRLSPGMASIIDVWIRPGATALTRMFIGASSLAAEKSRQ